MPEKKGTTMHHRRRSCHDPMCKDDQQNTTMHNTVKAICMHTSVHVNGNAVTASLLNSTMPMEQIAQDPRPMSFSCAPESIFVMNALEAREPYGCGVERVKCTVGQKRLEP